MITGNLKSQIDKLWEEFWTGGITNPLTVIEQISFLLFARLSDIAETKAEKFAQRSGQPLRGKFGAAEQHLRWSRFKQLDAPEMLRVVRDEVFPHRTRAFADELRPDAAPSTANIMADAMLLIQKPSLLVSAVNLIDRLPLTEGDTKGDLYEYLLSKLTTAGINGQFRTPRHIIRLMVEMLDPQPNETIGDPACGTAGFLVSVMEYLLQKYSSAAGVYQDENGVHYSGDLLEPYRAHIQDGLLHGFDFDVTMLRIASMNLMLHGIARPAIRYQDTLSNTFPERYPTLAVGGFDVLLANPPFTGSLDESDLHAALIGQVKTKKTELLFLSLILRMLRTGGRSATIVPDGVLFGSSKAHVALRRILVEDNQLEGVISLPSGVFKPYAGVSTAILLFTKKGQTEQVFFYDVKADGFSLDDKRTELAHDQHATDNLPDILARWRNPDAQADNPRTGQCFFVPKAEIVAQNYDLSLNRYKEVVYEEVHHDPPAVILAGLQRLETEIQQDLRELEAMLA